MEKYYLDSSAVVKRYVTEPGSQAVDALYAKAETGDAGLFLSLWNVGEVLGVFSERRRGKRLTEEEYERSVRTFAEETLKLHRLRAITITSVTTQLLVETWPLIAADDLYEADALQIVSCAQAGATLVSADTSLLRVATKHRVDVLDIRGL